MPNFSVPRGPFKFANSALGLHSTSNVEGTGGDMARSTCLLSYILLGSLGHTQGSLRLAMLLLLWLVVTSFASFSAH